MNYAFIGLAILIGLAAALLLYVAYKLVIVPFKEMEGSLSEVDSIVKNEAGTIDEKCRIYSTNSFVPNRLREKWIDYQKNTPFQVRKRFTEWVLWRALRSFPCEGDCGMNYCDENGCVERKRELVPAQEQIGKEVDHG